MALHLRESGRVDAPAILFLHGGGASGWMWEPVIRRLQEFHCLAPDLPGHGKSQEDVFSIRRTVEMLAEIVAEKTAGKEVSIAGLSLGAQVGLALLAEYPRRFYSAVLSGMLTEPLPGMLSVLDWSVRLYMPFRNIPWLIRSNMKAYGVPEEYYPQFAQDTNQLTREGFRSIMQASTTFQKPESLEEVETPTLLLVGEKEQRSIFESARDVAKAFPRSRAFVVKGAIHNWALQDPALFAQVVYAWVQNTSLPPQLEPLRPEEQAKKK